ncbi:hypothetical protein BJX61DRAFT_257144 [Aspergillus egyptiacus]|nr:hypothetical protein BJX61DRAFT_257144 [Aspergillus egyptiacus]
MLGLWAWFLRDNLKNGLHYEAKWCRRVVLAHGSKEDSEEFLSWGESRGLTDFLLESRLGNGEFFGWHHVPAGAAPDTEITASYIDADSFPIICAQEIFSIFFASIMHIVRDLGGTTTETGRAKMANSNVTQIQRIFTENGLGSARDAMTCIFPTLKIQGKIPRKRRES